MKIAVISDTHDNLANLEKAISFIKKEKIEVLIHCGDIFRPETAKEIFKNFSGKAHFVLSEEIDEKYFENIEENDLKNSDFKIWRNFGEIEIDNKKIAFSHSPQTAKNLASAEKYDIVFYGHLHKPWEKKIKKTRLVNPGNLAGLFFKSSFAIYNPENDELELKIL